MAGEPLCLRKKKKIKEKIKAKSAEGGQIKGVQRVHNPLAGRCAREGSALPKKE